jgi:hypothetical protein
VEHVQVCNKALAGAEGQRLWEYWRDALGDVPAPPRFAGERQGTAEEPEGATHRFEVPAPSVARLREMARAEGVTPFVVMMAALHVLLGRHTGAEDIVVGSLASGRTRARFRNTVGHFVNPVAVRVRLDGDPSVRDLLARTREATMGALRNQEFPFPLVIERLNPKRRTRDSVLFRTLLVLQKRPPVSHATTFDCSPRWSRRPIAT